MGLFSAKCLSQARLEGKTVVITGANTGIGKATAKDLFIRGARVIIACRNLDRANEAVEEIRRDCDGYKNLGQIHVALLDLSSLKSVRLCAKHLLETEKTIDILINNAGICACPESKTEDGFELQFGTNHLGHFLFTLLLLPKICQNPPARIVNVASFGHSLGGIDLDDLNWTKRRYSAKGAYYSSKLANVLFTKELARQLEEAKIKGVTVYSLHPGFIATDLGRHLDATYFSLAKWVWEKVICWIIKTPEQGAQTTIYCAIDEKCANETGLYYVECAPARTSKQALNVEDGKRLWKESLKFVGLKDFNPFKQEVPN